MLKRVLRVRKHPITGLYYPNLVPMSAIRRYVRRIVERFRPEKVILFGSYAYGNPTPDSDVDLLVVMPARNELDQAVRIDTAIEERPFALVLLVRTPKNLERRLRWGDWFLREVVTRGKVMYAKTRPGLGAKGRARLRDGAAAARGPAVAYRSNLLSLSAGDRKVIEGPVAGTRTRDRKTHDIEVLIDKLLPTDGTLRRYRRGARTLTRYAVDYRYPGVDTTARQARAAFAKAMRFRREIRRRLVLPSQ